MLRRAPGPEAPRPHGQSRGNKAYHIYVDLAWVATKRFRKKHKPWFVDGQWFLLPKLSQPDSKMLPEIPAPGVDARENPSPEGGAD